MQVDTNEICCTFTLLITWITAKISKKLPWFEDYLIPIQNMLIGLCVAITEWIFTKDFNYAVAVSGIVAGGIYDVLHNINIILKKALQEKKDVQNNK